MGFCKYTPFILQCKVQDRRRSHFLCKEIHFVFSRIFAKTGQELVGDQLISVKKRSTFGIKLPDHLRSKFASGKDLEVTVEPGTNVEGS